MPRLKHAEKSTDTTQLGVPRGDDARGVQAARLRGRRAGGSGRQRESNNCRASEAGSRSPPAAPATPRHRRPRRSPARTPLPRPMTITRGCSESPRRTRGSGSMRRATARIAGLPSGRRLPSTASPESRSRTRPGRPSHQPARDRDQRCRQRLRLLGPPSLMSRTRPPRRPTITGTVPTPPAPDAEPRVTRRGRGRLDRAASTPTAAREPRSPPGTAAEFASPESPSSCPRTHDRPARHRDRPGRQLLRLLGRLHLRRGLDAPPTPAITGTDPGLTGRRPDPAVFGTGAEAGSTVASTPTRVLRDPARYGNRCRLRGRRDPVTVTDARDDGSACQRPRRRRQRRRAARAAVPLPGARRSRELDRAPRTGIAGRRRVTCSSSRRCPRPLGSFGLSPPRPIRGATAGRQLH